MLDHISVPVSDLERARRFFDATLAALGHVRLHDIDRGEHEEAGYGPSGHGGEPAFWIGGAKLALTLPPPREGAHVAFQAKDRAAVDAFHAAALEAGATDNGAPGLRPHYHANYYAAFVVDQDGNHLEAVCHTP